jgi:hypothetical protein
MLSLDIEREYKRLRADCDACELIQFCCFLLKPIVGTQDGPSRSAHGKSWRKSAVLDRYLGHPWLSCAQKEEHLSIIIKFGPSP